MSKVTAINIIIKKKNQLRKLKKECVSSIYIDVILEWLNDIQKELEDWLWYKSRHGRTKSEF